MGKGIDQSCQCQCGDEGPKSSLDQKTVAEDKSDSRDACARYGSCRVERENYYGVRPLARWEDLIIGEIEAREMKRVKALSSQE